MVHPEIREVIEIIYFFHHTRCFSQFALNLVSVQEYLIYSINRPGRLLNFRTLKEGAYSRLGTSVVCLFCNKTIKNAKI